MKPVSSIKCAASFSRVVTSFSTWFTGPILSWDHLENTLPTNKELTLTKWMEGWHTTMVLHVTIPDLSVIGPYICVNGNSFLFCLQELKNIKHGSWAKWKESCLFVSPAKYIQVFVSCDETVASIMWQKLSQVSFSTSTASYLHEKRNKKQQTKNRK